MILALSSLLFLIFVALSVLHIYWALGGNWGIDSALPTKEEDSTQVLKPRIAETLIVAMGLLSFALLYLIKTGLVSMALPSWVFNYGGWIVPSIFLIRVIGDFKYVGLFKKIKSTKFAKADSKYFIPLCSFLAIAGFLVQNYS